MTQKQDEALRRLGENIDPDDAVKLLAALRWNIDQIITNDFGERVWLGPCWNETGEKRIGITDCCYESAPCCHHARLLRLARAGKIDMPAGATGDSPTGWAIPDTPSEGD